MPYSEELAERVRARLASVDGVTEQAMFGGLAFLVGGNMAAALTGGDELLVRLGPEGAAAAAGAPHARPADMAGRPMRGWIVVGRAGIAAEDALEDWVARGVAFARSLPPKG